MSSEELYRLKTLFLVSWLGNEVSALDFYGDIFCPEEIERRGYVSDHLANPIIAYTVEDEGHRYLHNEIVFRDMKAFEEVQGNDFAVCSLCSYSGKTRSAKNAYKLQGICIDLDGVGLKELESLRMYFEQDMLPVPTYLVNSGYGLHVYYIFYEPIPLYPHLIPYLQKLKEGLTRIVWNKETSNYKIENRQYQGIFQGFRIVGTCSKLGRTKKSKQNYRVKAYKCGKKVDLMYLNEYVYDQYKVPEGFDSYGSGIWGEDHLTLDKAQILYPEWYEKRIIQKKPVGQYVCNRGLYYWWLNEIQTDGNARDGNRYNCIAVLFIMAIKCNIEKEAVLQDALSLVEPFNELTVREDNAFTVDDVMQASKYYKKSYARYSINAIEVKTGIRINRRPKKERKNQEEHLEEARAIRDIRMRRQGKKWTDGNGRPKGSGSKEQTVREWQQQNPNGRKIDCYRDIKLSRMTIDKWWKQEK